MNEDKLIDLQLCRNNTLKAQTTVDNFNRQGINIIAVLGTNKKGELQIDTSLNAESMIKFLSVMLKTLLETNNRHKNNISTNLKKL